MKKDITICFRTDNTIKNFLNEIATEERMSLSSVIEKILQIRLETIKDRRIVGGERRYYNRRQVSLPAFIIDSAPRDNAIQTAKVIDLSLGGVRITVPKEINLSICRDTEGDQFHIIFTFPDVAHPIKMKCQPQRISDCGKELQIGASFVDADFKGYQDLQAHLL